MTNSSLFFNIPFNEDVTICDFGRIVISSQTSHFAPNVIMRFEEFYNVIHRQGGGCGFLEKLLDAGVSSHGAFVFGVEPLFGVPVISEYGNRPVFSNSEDSMIFPFDELFQAKHEHSMIAMIYKIHQGVVV